MLQMSFFFLLPFHLFSVIGALFQVWWHLILFACYFRAHGIKRVTMQDVKIADYDHGVV